MGNIVDLGNATFTNPSIPGALGGVAISSGGIISNLSGLQVGDYVDLISANNFCNVYVVGKAIASSGPCLVGVQTSDGTTSGSFTDPTSGLAQLPTKFASGGWLIIGSGGNGDGMWGTQVSGLENIISGFSLFAAFQRPQRYARLVLGSGNFAGLLQAGFVSQLKTMGSGGGFSFSPSSGSVNV